MPINIGPYGLMNAGAGLLGASGPSTVPTSFGQTIGAGLSGYLQGRPVDLEEQRRQKMQNSLGQISASLDPKVVKASWTTAAKPIAGQAGVPMTYLARLAQSESGNRNIPQQVNPTGSAFGPFQFTEGTWSDVINRHPELGLTPEDRFQPAAQGRAIVAFTKDNSSQLQSSLGRIPTQSELALAHRFGPGGATALLRANRNQSVASVLPDAAKANPQWADMTVDDIVSNTADAVGDEEPPHAPSGLLGDGSTPVTSGGGLADLLGGGQIAPQPFGSGLQNMTPQMQEILQVALRDPTLGPQALQALFQVAGNSQSGAITPATAARLSVEMLGQKSREATQKERLQVQKDIEAARQQAQATTQQRLNQVLGLQQQKAGFEQRQADITNKFREQEKEIQQQRLDWEKAKTGQEATQKIAADTWGNAVKGGETARTNLDNLAQLDNLGSKIQTGTFSGNAKTLLNLAQSLGINTAALGIEESAAPYEAYNAIAAHMAMSLRNPPGQDNLMPGQMSNYEDQLLQSMGPQLTKSSQGNSMMIAIQKRINERARDFARFAVAYKGPKDQDWLNASQDWWQRPENQLITPQLQSRIDELSKPPAATQSNPAVQSAAPPQSAIDFLKANPNLAPHFDQKYGAGSSSKYLGK